MTKLLVSVRDAEEARSAWAGGADVIDVKEPANGSLGAADEATIAEIVQALEGKAVVSAALGELIEGRERGPSGLTYVKWGLAGAGADWRAQWQRRALGQTALPVVVGYADWQCAQAPNIREVVDFVCESQLGGVLLIDTHCKDATLHGHTPTLLDWLRLDDLEQYAQECRVAGVQLALAGSLGMEDLRTLYPLVPDWFAVRGLVCAEGRRTLGVDRARVAGVKRFLQELC